MFDEFAAQEQRDQLAGALLGANSKYAEVNGIINKEGWTPIPLRDYQGYSENVEELPPPSVQALNAANPVLQPSGNGGGNLSLGTAAFDAGDLVVLVPTPLAATIFSGNSFDTTDPDIQQALNELETATLDELETDLPEPVETLPDQNPLLAINKTVLSVDPVGDGLANQVGDVINYQITVTNSGNQTLNNVLVTDPLTGLSETIPSLAPGESQVFNTSYTLTQQDIDTNGGGDGTIDNTATADSDETDPAGSSTSTTIPQNPLLAINKTVLSVDPVGDGLANQVGDVINYQITVTNSGNQTLNLSLIHI